MSGYDVPDYRVNSIAVALDVPYFLVDEEGLKPYSNDPTEFREQVTEDAEFLGLPMERVRNALYAIQPGIYPRITPPPIPDDLRRRLDEDLARQRYETVVLPTSPDHSLLTPAFFEYQQRFVTDKFLFNNGWGTVWNESPRIFFGEPHLEKELIRVIWDLRGSTPVDVFNQFTTSRDFPAVGLYDGKRLLRKSRLGVHVPTLRDQPGALQIVAALGDVLVLRFTTDEGGRLVDGFVDEMSMPLVESLSDSLHRRPIDSMVVGIRGYIDMFGLNIDVVGLLDFVMVDEQTRLHMSVNETKGISNRPRFTVFDFPANQAQREQGVVEVGNGAVYGDMTVMTDYGEPRNVGDEQGYGEDGTDKFVRLRILSARDEMGFRFLAFFVGAVILKSLERQSDVIRLYAQYDLLKHLVIRHRIGIPPFEPEEVIRVKEYRYVAPNLFISDYPRYNCTWEHQPAFTEDEDVAADYSYLPFTIKEDDGAEKTLYFYCHREQYPVIQLKKNKLKNSSIYPMIPCCFEKPIEKKGSFKTTILKTVNDLDPGRMAYFYHNELALLLINTLGIPDVRVGYDQRVTRRWVGNLLDPIAEMLSTTREDLLGRLSRAHPEVLKSELFDRTLDEIKDEMGRVIDTEGDSLDLFVHRGWMEEAIGINVLMLSRAPPFYVQTRFARFMNNTHRTDRHSVIFFYNSVDQVNLLEIDRRRMFEGTSTERLIRTLRREYLLMENGKLFADVPPPDWIRPYAQIIDASGKTRVLFTKAGTVITPPLHSLNLPHATTDEPVTRFNVDLLPDTPTSKVLDRGRTVGVWVGRFFLLVDGDVNAPPSEDNPLVDIKWRRFDMVRDDERRARIILELTIWMYVGTTLSVDDFLAEYLDVVDEVPDYQIDRLDAFLPADGDLSTIESRFPTFIVDGRLRVTEKIKRGIKYFLKEFYPNGATERPRQITHLYNDPNDFPREPDELVTVGNFPLSHYFETSQTVHNTLDFEFITRRDPYFYRSGQHLYLIQNVKDATFAKAAYVSRLWEQHRYNIGFDVEVPIGWDPFQHSILVGAIANDRSLGVVERHEDDEIFVLRYFGDFYAAILAIN